MYAVKKYIILSLFSLIALLGFGQAKFYAKGSSEAYTGKTYVITFVLENGQGKNFRVPQAYPGFEIIGGPNQSSSYQWVNGKTTSSVSYSFYLQPVKEGTFTIPKASVEVGDETLLTQEIQVTIKKGAATNNQARRQPNQRQQPSQNNETETGDWKKEVAEQLFVRMYTDKTNPYVGEQVNLYLKLYQNINSMQTQVTEIPELDGFWKQDFNIQDAEWKKEEYNGKWYNTVLINKYALFPLREGTFTFDPLKMQTYIRLRTRGNPNDIWEQFFGSYEDKRYDFESNRVKLNVKALPLANQPENFSGAVGRFKYTAKLDSTNAQTGSAIALKTSITGTGNIMMIDAPKLALDESFEVYDPESKEYISKKSNYINGTKKYNYQIIAQKPGNYELEPLSFSYFDLKSKTYKTVYSDTLRLGITPGPDYVEEVVEVEDSTTTAEDVLMPLANFLDSKKQSGFVPQTIWYKTMYASPLFLALLLFVLKRRKDNYNPDLVALNRKKANKVALQKLKQAAVFLKAKDQKGFYNEVVRSLWNYVSLKLNIDKEDLSKDNINEKLLAHQVSVETANEYIAVIKNCERAIYAPTTDVAMQDDFERAKELIIKLESVL